MSLGKKIFDILQDPQPFRRLFSVIIGRSGLGKLFKIKIEIQDYCIIFHPTGFCSAFWYNPNAYSEDYQFITSFLKEGDLYLDIGANVGVTTIPAARCIGELGRVIAFEPHPVIYLYLQENIKLNDLMNVELHNCALGNQRGHIHFTNKYTDETNRVATSSNRNIEVPIKILDDVANKLDSIALLKIDVEGYEKYVIEGAKMTLKKVGCIYFEVSEGNFSNFGYGTSDVLIALEQCGFRLFKRQNEREILEINRQYIPSYGYENLFGIRDIDDFQNRTQWQVSTDLNYAQPPFIANRTFIRDN
jgi:FkbM family methyltransferase